MEYFWIIDPDVFEASLVSEDCHVALKKRWESKEPNRKHIIVLDEGAIETAYGAEAFRAKIADHNAGKILSEIFRHRGITSRVRTIQPVPVKNGLDECIRGSGCINDLEPDLLRLALSNEVNELYLLLVGKDLVRPRALFKKANKDNLKHCLKKAGINHALQIKHALDTDVPMPTEQEYQYQELRFENEVRDAMRQKLCEHLKYTPAEYYGPSTPAEIHNHPCADRKKSGELDACFYEENYSPRHVWVGESQLKRGGDRRTHRDKMQRLVDKMEAVRVYEARVRPGMIQVYGYLFTDAQEMTREARELAEQNAIGFVPIQLSDWRTNIKRRLTPQDLPGFEPG